MFVVVYLADKGVPIEELHQLSLPLIRTPKPIMSRRLKSKIVIDEKIKKNKGFIENWFFID